MRKKHYTLDNWESKLSSLDAFNVLEEKDLKIITAAKSKIPSWSKILKECFESLEAEFTRESLIQNFSASIIKIEQLAYNTFQKYESIALSFLVVKWMEEHGREIRDLQKNGIIRSLSEDEPLLPNLKSIIGNILEKAFPVISKFQISTSQMRKKRAGETFQEIVASLLRKIDISCERVYSGNGDDFGHSNIVVPSVNVARMYPDRAIFIDCPHTLAERWWASTSIPQKGRTAYLVTLDNRISRKKAIRINEQGIVMFVPDHVAELDKLSDLPWVRKLSKLPEELLRRQ